MKKINLSFFDVLVILGAGVFALLFIGYELYLCWSLLSSSTRSIWENVLGFACLSLFVGLLGKLASEILNYKNFVECEKI